MSETARVLNPTRDKNTETDHWHRWEMSPLEKGTFVSDARRPTSGQQVTAAPQPASTTKKVVDPAPEREAEIKRQLFEVAKQEAREEAWKTAYDAGYQAGYESGERDAKSHEASLLEAHLTEKLEPIERLVMQFAQALSDYQDARTQAVTELALETGRQLAGHALSLSPEYIVDDVQAMLTEEGHGTETLRVYLCPDDLALVQERLHGMFDQVQWQLRGDSTLARGDCRVETDQQTRIGTRHDRWQRLMHAVNHKEH